MVPETGRPICLGVPKAGNRSALHWLWGRCSHCPRPQSLSWSGLGRWDQRQPPGLCTMVSAASLLCSTPVQPLSNWVTLDKTPPMPQFPYVPIECC